MYIYIYIYMYIYIYVCVCVCIYIHKGMCIYIYVYIYILLHVIDRCIKAGINIFSHFLRPALYIFMIKHTCKLKMWRAKHAEEIMKLTNYFNFTQLKLKYTKQKTCSLHDNARSYVYKIKIANYCVKGSSLARILIIVILTLSSINILANISNSKRQIFLPHYSNNSLAFSLNASRQIWLTHNETLSKRLTVRNMLLTEARDKILSRSEAIIWPAKVGLFIRTQKIF